MSGTTSILGPSNQIEIYRGSTKTYELEVVDAESVAINLTGARVICTVKCDVSKPAPLIQKDSAAGATQVEITSPLEGKAHIKFIPSDTKTMDVGEYVFDVWVVLATSEQYPVITPSPFIVLAGVTIL